MWIVWSVESRVLSKYGSGVWSVECGVEGVE